MITPSHLKELRAKYRLRTIKLTIDCGGWTLEFEFEFGPSSHEHWIREFEESPTMLDLENTIKKIGLRTATLT